MKDETQTAEPVPMPQGVFPVIAYRYGMRDDHSYLVGVYASRELADAAAEMERDDRGGKYACEVLACEVERASRVFGAALEDLPKQVGYFESPYFGLLGKGHQCADGRDCEEAREKRRDAVQWYLEETRLPVGVRRAIGKVLRVLSMRWLWEGGSQPNQ